MSAARTRNPARRAYTLIELMISLSITAALMAAMAGAFAAAGSAVEMNDRYFRAVQQSRTALDLIMTEVRHCQAMTSATSTSITLTPGPVAAPDFNGNSITITYYPASNYGASSTDRHKYGCVTLTNNSTGNERWLAGEEYDHNNPDPQPIRVTSAAFTSTTGQNMSGQTKWVAISLTMTVQTGQNLVTLSDSAAPRVYLVSLYQ